MSLPLPSLPAVGRALTAGFVGLPRPIWLVAAVVLLNSAGTMVSTFLALYLFKVLQLSELSIGIIIGAYGAGVVTGSLMAGWLLSRIAAHFLAAGSLAAMGIGFLALSSVTDPLIFLFGIFFCANCEGSFRPPSMLLAMRECAPIDRPRANAAYYTAQSLGYAVGAAAGGLLSQVDFSLLFLVNGSTNLLAAAMALWLLRRAARQAANMLVDEAEEPAGVSPASVGPFLALCAAALLHYCVSQQRLSTYPLYLTSHYGLSAAEIGLLFSTNGLLIAITGITLNGLLKSLDRRKVASAGAVALAASFALLPLGDAFAVALLLCIMMSLGDVLFSSSAVALAYRLAPRRKEGRRLAIFFAIAYSARSLGPATGLWIFSALGASTLWLLCAFVGAISVALLCGFVRSR